MKAIEIANGMMMANRENKGVIGRLLEHDYPMQTGYALDKWVAAWVKECDIIIKKYTEVKDDPAKIEELNNLEVDLQLLDFNLIKDVTISRTDRHFLKPLLTNLPE